MSTQTFASRSDSRRSVTRLTTEAPPPADRSQTLAIFGRCCLSCRGDMFFRTTDVCLCLLKGVGCLSSVRYRLMLATSSRTIMIVYSSLPGKGSTTEAPPPTANGWILPDISPYAEGAV